MRVRPGRPSPPSTRLPSTGLGDRDERRVPHGPTGPPTGPYGPRSPGRVPRATYERAAHQTPDRARAEADHRHSPRTPSPEQADRTRAMHAGRRRPPPGTPQTHVKAIPDAAPRPHRQGTRRTRTTSARPEQANWSRHEPCAAPSGTPGPGPGPGPPGPSEAPQTRAAAVTRRDPCATSRSTPAPAPVRVSCWVASSRPWGRMPVGCGRQARAGTPVRAVTTGSRAWCISSPTERKNVRGAP